MTSKSQRRYYPSRNHLARLEREFDKARLRQAQRTTPAKLRKEPPFVPQRINPVKVFERLQRLRFRGGRIPD
jgi:hypothetical protein